MRKISKAQLDAGNSDLGWVIEHHGSLSEDPSFYCGTFAQGLSTINNVRHCWNKDRNEAIRFARDVDAQAMAIALFGEEHEHRIVLRSWAKTEKRQVA